MYTHEAILNLEKMMRDKNYFINNIYDEIDNRNLVDSLLKYSSESKSTFIAKRNAFGKTQSIVISVLSSLMFEEYKVIVIMCDDKDERYSLREEIKEKIKTFDISPSLEIDNKKHLHFSNGTSIYFTNSVDMLKGRSISKLFIITDNTRTNDIMHCYYPCLLAGYSSAHIFSDDISFKLNNMIELKE